MSNTNVDFSVLRATLNATKPPYKCPIKDCEKIYRSFNGMQQHFDDHEDRLQKNNRKKNRNMDINSLRDKANKKIVEVELGGQLIQFDASKPMKLVATENGKKPSCITVLKTSKMTSQKNHSHSFEKSDVGILSSSLPEPKFKILDTYVRRPTLKRTCSSDPGSIPLEEIVLYDADEEVSSVVFRLRTISAQVMLGSWLASVVVCFSNEWWLKCNEHLVQSFRMEILIQSTNDPFD